MGLPIPIIDSIIDAGKTIVDKIWMDAGEKEKLEFTKEQLQKQFEFALKKANDRQELAKLENTLKTEVSQQAFANDQFGKAEILKDMGWAGKVILLGRASIRWIITGGSMIFTWKIMNQLLTTEVIKALAAGTLATSGTWLITLLVCLIVGIPVFYVSGISIEKILGARNKL